MNIGKYIFRDNGSLAYLIPSLQISANLIQETLFYLN